MKMNLHPRTARLATGLLAIFIGIAACSLPQTSPSPELTATPSPIAPTAAAAATIPPVSPTAIPATAVAATAVLPQPTRTNPVAPVPANTKTPAQLSEVTIYFVAVGDNGQTGPKIGCGDSLVAVKQPIEPTSGVIRAALNKLFSDKQQNIGQSGLYNALWQSSLSVGSARVDNGVATVNITGQVMLGGECDTPRFKAQIESTILAQPGVTGAIISLNGKPIDQALSLK